MNSPVKVVRRKSFSSYEDIQRDCRKKLTYETEKREKRCKSLLMAVLTRNYKKRIMEEAERKKKENQSKPRIIFVRRSNSLNHRHTPVKKQKSYELLGAHERLKEKIDYVQRLESEFNDAKVRMEKTEKEEDRVRTALRNNKTYLHTLFNQIKVLASHKVAKLEERDDRGSFV